MESRNRLQQRPEIQVAIGQLTAQEQAHVQIYLRILAPRLRVPCVPIAAEKGEITLAPSSINPEMACACSAYGQRSVERPLRMVPLADALTELIDELLANDPSVTAHLPRRRNHDRATEAQPDEASAEPTSRILLQVLFDRTHSVPVRLRTLSGIDLLIDPHFHSAWTEVPPEQLPSTIADEPVVQAEQVGLGTFQERISRGGGLYPIQVEQLCWLSSGAPGVPTPLDRWLQDRNAILRLTTWPNLSAQRDYPLWLKVLPAMWHGALVVDDALRQLEAAGIGPQRARHGLALLCLFRHATRDGSIDSDAKLARAPAEPHVDDDVAEHRSLLGRLKNRLRAMVG